MDRYVRPCIAEMVGTFALCFIGAGVICTDAVAKDAGIGLVGVAIAHGLILSIAVTATMNISGGHINPAVTTTMWVYKKMDGDKALAYIASQLLGAAIAGGFIVMIFGARGPAADVHLGTPHINRELLRVTADPTSLWGRYQLQFTAIGIETVLTFLLVFAVFGTAVDPRAPRVGGFGIGLTIAADILLGGPLTGACMNPARAFGPGIWEAFMFGFGRMSDQLVYWIGPIIGGLLAGGLYLNYLLPPEPPKPEIVRGGKA